MKKKEKRREEKGTIEYLIDEKTGEEGRGRREEKGRMKNEKNFDEGKNT